jgi:hypothetical protein
VDRRWLPLGGLWLLAAAHHHLAHAGGLPRHPGAGDLRRLGLIDPSRTPPRFHLCHRRRHAGAFFIVTDPVSGATTPRGKLIFAAGIALLTWIIRTFGAYPDGIAFAVLLMNICVPLIDMKTQPPVFGHKKQDAGDGSAPTGNERASAAPAMRAALARTAAIMLAFTWCSPRSWPSPTVPPARSRLSAEGGEAEADRRSAAARRYDNDLLADVVSLPPTRAARPRRRPAAHGARARRQQPAALVFEARAPDGYSGRIRLLILAVAPTDAVGVRVAHKETPGLGDYIDPKKDRNKDSPWIASSTAAGFGTVPPTGR